jgi:transmembrane sensor
MSDLSRKMQEAREHVAAPWTPARAADVEGRMLRRRLRRRAAGALGAVAVMGALVVGGLSLIRRPAQGPIVAATTGAATPTTRAPSAGAPLRFADGSVVSPLDDRAVVRTREATPRRAVVALERGGARFDVAHDPTRVFRVEIDDVAVEVLGTRFLVERVDARVRVSVVEGRVRVTWPGGQTELHPGDAQLFPGEEAVVERAPKVSGARAPRAPTAGWREMAHDGDFDAAYSALERQGPTAVGDRPAELLLAADVARLSGHPAEAVSPLERVVSRHARDPRAPLAAFTLGRVFLEELGRPRDAAGAFASALRLEPSGPLAEDALARQVEAWSRAGDESRAREAALEYVARYPHGRREKSVRRFGGVE